MEAKTIISDSLAVRVQMTRYLLDKLPGQRCESLKLIKLAVLADVYKLRKYGETISGDYYVALKNGPVPSNLADIVGFDSEHTSAEEIEYAQQYIKNNNSTVEVNKEKEIDTDYISEVDAECLDYVLEKYGDKDINYLINHETEGVHAFDAWKKHGIHDFGEGQCASIDKEDFFVNDGPVQVEESTLEVARENYRLYGCQ